MFKLLHQPDFLGTSSQMREKLSVKAHYLTMEVAADVHKQLGLKYHDKGKSMAYHTMRQRTPIVFDTGCSVSITPFLKDFVGALKQADHPNITGVGDHKS